MEIVNGIKVNVKAIDYIEWILICEREGAEVGCLIATKSKNFGWAPHFLSGYEDDAIKSLGLNKDDYSFYYVEYDEREAIYDKIDATSLTVDDDEGKHYLKINELGVTVNTEGFDLHKVVGLLGKLNEKELKQVKLEIEKVEKERVNVALDKHVGELNKLLLPVTQYIEGMIDTHGEHIGDIEWFINQRFKTEECKYSGVTLVNFE